MICRQMSSPMLATAPSTKATKTMTAMAGRASYVPDSQVQGTPDPGAMFVAFVLGAVANMGDDI